MVKVLFKKDAEVLVEVVPNYSATVVHFHILVNNVVCTVLIVNNDLKSIEWIHKELEKVPGTGYTLNQKKKISIEPIP